MLTSLSAIVGLHSITEIGKAYFLHGEETIVFRFRSDLGIYLTTHKTALSMCVYKYMPILIIGLWLRYMILTHETADLSKEASQIISLHSTLIYILHSYSAESMDPSVCCGLKELIIDLKSLTTFDTLFSVVKQTFHSCSHFPMPKVTGKLM